MGQYTNKGLYNGYSKNNKEREALDYYATPRAEVLNILKELQYDFSNCTILEPCIGGGHMAQGIEDYIKINNQKSVKLIGTDIKDRGFKGVQWSLTYDLDYLADEYPMDTADWVILNPPYSTIEPFTIRTLEIAQRGIIMLARLQYLEGEGRYSNIFAHNPPTDIYVYANRIQCWRNGEEPEGSSAQAYCWVVWDKLKERTYGTQVHWIKRAE